MMRPIRGLIKHRIDEKEQTLHLLEKALRQSLKGDYIYVIESGLGSYQRRRKTYQHYLKLSNAKQQHYCRIRSLYSLSLYQTASLYEASNQPDKALECHLKAVLSGNLCSLFSNRPVPDTDISELTTPRQQALSLFFGVGQYQNFNQARILFHQYLETTHHPEIAYLCLGLIAFYGLGQPINLGQASNYFDASAKHGIPLATMYLGLCQLEQGKFYQAKRSLKKAIKHGFPLAQLGMGMIYEHGYGCFFKKPRKAEQFYRLNRLQKEIIEESMNQDQKEHQI